MYGKLQPEMVHELMSVADTDGDGDVECAAHGRLVHPCLVAVLAS